MPMHRKNKAPAVKSDTEHETWFWNNVNRQRRRNAIAKISRRKNRGK